MKLQELAVANPIQQAAKVFESYFGNRVDFNTVSKGQARNMLKRVRGLIAEHRRTPEFHRSERNPSYLKLVMMEQALAAAATAPGAAAAANPQAQAGMQAAQIQQKKKQIQDAIKAKQGEIAQLQKQMNDPTMMAMAEAQLDELSPATLTSYAGKRSGQAAWAGGVAKGLAGRPAERQQYRDTNWTDPKTNYGAQGTKYAKFNQQAMGNIKKAIGKGATPNVQPYDQAAQRAQGAYGDASNPVTRKKGVAEGSGQFYVYHKVKGDRAGGADYDLLKTFPDKDSAMAFAQTYNNKISADKKNFHSAVVRTKSVKKDMDEGVAEGGYEHPPMPDDYYGKDNKEPMGSDDNYDDEMAEGDNMSTFEQAECNHTMEGEYCPEHGLAECGNYGMYESELARIKSLALFK